MSSSHLSKSIYSEVLPKTKKTRSGFNQYRKFNFLFLAITSIPIILVGLFNFVIDPYAIYKTPDFGGLNHEKIGKDNNDRLYKAVDIIRIKPRTILLGSSRTKQGLNPNHPTLDKYKPVYNLALNGTNVHELLRYLQHTITNQKDLKEVIFGIDFFMFNEYLKNQSSFSENRLEKQYIDWQDIINTLFSTDTLLLSKDTVIASLNNPKKDENNENYNEKGFFPHRRANDGKTQERFVGGINQYLDFHNKYKFSQQHLADFKKIVDICKQKGIILKIFISPNHAADLETIRATGHWETLEQWKREIVKIIPVWDFSGYNTITTEPIKSKMKNYVDNSHYRTEVGDLILRRIFSDNSQVVPADFGILLTPDNVESYLAKSNSDRVRWEKEHPEEVKLVWDVKNKFDRK